MPTDISANIAAFFKSPAIPPGEGRVSTLHLLRREIQECLFLDSEPIDEQDRLQQFSTSERRRLFASLLVILSGFDLVAKFAAGSDERGKMGQRFREFLETFGGDLGRGMLPDQAQAVFDVRNALMHSFGLYIAGEPLVRIVDSHGVIGSAVIRLLDSTWELRVGGLYRMFVRSVESYARKITHHSGLQEKYALMYPKYGVIEFYLSEG